MKNKKVKPFLEGLFFAALVWNIASTAIQSFKCPKMDDAQLFIHIPKSFIGQWENCK